jgi:hypothetical protein
VRAPLALGALLFAVSAAATQPALPAERGGYAFAWPRVLAQQRIFGLAHGIDLLARACTTHERAAAAYAAWYARQRSAIEAARADLGRYYFGDAAAAPLAVEQKMNLRQTLDGPPSAAELEAACATLPEALGRPRYDLVRRFRLEEYMARTVAAIEVDARDAHCREELVGEEREAHEARHALWREINDEAARDAAAVLEREWPGDAPAPSYAEWVDRLRKETHAHGDRAACLEFSASLQQPDSYLSNVFRMPPPPDPK